MTAFAISFSPLLPLPILFLLALAVVAVAAPLILRRAHGGALRLLAGAIILLILAHPVIRTEDRTALRDKVLVVQDTSPSMDIGERRRMANRAIDYINENVADDAEIRTLSLGAVGDTQTYLAGPINEQLAGLATDQLSAIIIVSDGQVHDTEQRNLILPAGVPVHHLISGTRSFKDRRVIIEQAPAFAIVGRSASMVIRIEDSNDERPTADARIRLNGEEVFSGPLATGVSHEIQFVPTRRGESIIEIYAAPLDGETQLDNNHAFANLNAVRDRLRVLLISGTPHPGERIWRSVLRADPAVDLIHFTILRLPSSRDMTPVNQMALIPFPTQELFDTSLDRFDLVIFDRYTLRGVLLMEYLENLARYVETGGAILVASGPELADPFNLFTSPLGRVLPAEPTGRMIDQPFKPALTAAGRRHPVTSILNAPDQHWGRWFRLAQSRRLSGDVLMDGPNGSPLLITSRVGEGRVAQLLSDQIWLWGRGVEGGGPHRELIRRTVHWLMQEPDLEEEALIARAEGLEVSLTRRGLGDLPREVRVQGPEGYETEIPLEETASGIATGAFAAPRPGLYHFNDTSQRTSLPIGNLNGLENRDMRPTETHLAPWVAASGGGSFWLEEAMPNIRRVNRDSLLAGNGWMGLPRRGAYRVDALHQQPLIPAWLGLILILFSVFGAWWRESHD